MPTQQPKQAGTRERGRERDSGREREDGQNDTPTALPEGDNHSDGNWLAALEPFHGLVVSRIWLWRLKEGLSISLAAAVYRLFQTGELVGRKRVPAAGYTARLSVRFALRVLRPCVLCHHDTRKGGRRKDDELAFMDSPSF